MNIQELKTKLEDLDVPREWYHLEKYGNDDQKVCIARKNNKWSVYYSERGTRLRIKEFDNEDDACNDVLKRLLISLDYEKRHKRPCSCNFKQ